MEAVLGRFLGRFGEVVVWLLQDDAEFGDSLHGKAARLVGRADVCGIAVHGSHGVRGVVDVVAGHVRNQVFVGGPEHLRGSARAADPRERGGGAALAGDALAVLAAFAPLLIEFIKQNV